MENVIEKYLQYIKSISKTQLEEDLDVQKLSRQLGLGKQGSMDGGMRLPNQLCQNNGEARYPASPATTLWRAAASQWQQASSQWHETARWTPKLAHSQSRFTVHSPVFSPPMLKKPSREQQDDNPLQSPCAPGLQGKLQSCFLNRLTLASTPSADGPLAGSIGKPTQGNLEMCLKPKSDAEIMEHVPKIAIVQLHAKQDLGLFETLSPPARTKLPPMMSAHPKSVPTLTSTGPRCSLALHGDHV